MVGGWSAASSRRSLSQGNASPAEAATDLQHGENREVGLIPEGMGIERADVAYAGHTTRASLPRLRHIGALRNFLGDFGIVLTGADRQLTTRQRRLKAYLDGKQMPNGVV